MAVAAFVQLLVGSVRANRHELAVVKAIGGSRGQVGRSILWHASFLALPAVALGLPAGVILGRWGWGMLARSLGVPSVPVVPMLALVAVAALALVAANLLAIWPSWQAAHIRPSEALRAESSSGCRRSGSWAGSGRSGASGALVSALAAPGAGSVDTDDQPPVVGTIRR